MFEAEIESRGSGFFVTMKDLFDNPEGLLTAIGLDNVEFIQQNFRDEKFGGKGRQYKKRAIPNRAGIWSDIEEGKKPNSSRLEDRPVLRDSGELMRSITFRIQGETVLTGTNKPYAKKLQHGGIVTLNKTASDFDDRINIFLQQYHGQMDERQVMAVDALKSISQLSLEVPPRKFIGYTKERVEEVFNDYIEENYGS